MAQPAHRPPTPARSDAEEGSGRGRTKGFFKQKGPFTGQEANPRVSSTPLRLRSGPGTPASPFREATGTFGGSSGFDPRDDDGEWELPPGVPLTTRAADESRPHRADDRSRTALGARDDRRGPGSTGLARTRATTLAAPGTLAEVGVMIAGLIPIAMSPPRVGPSATSPTSYGRPK